MRCVLYNTDNVKGLIVFRLLVHSFRAAHTEHSNALEHACIISLLREYQIHIWICVVFVLSSIDTRINRNSM